MLYQVLHFTIVQWRLRPAAQQEVVVWRGVWQRKAFKSEAEGIYNWFYITHKFPK